MEEFIYNNEVYSKCSRQNDLGYIFYCKEGMYNYIYAVSYDECFRFYSSNDRYMAIFYKNKYILPKYIINIFNNNFSELLQTIDGDSLEEVTYKIINYIQNTENKKACDFLKNKK
jgi:hypothetical protein